MAKYSPLSRLLGNIKEEDEGNIYDDGSIWTKPESTTSNGVYESPRLVGSSSMLGLSNLPGNLSNKVVDPLENPRNQINYYTNELEDLGQEVEKPSVLKKTVGAFLKGLEIATVAPNSIENAITGFTHGFNKVAEESDKIQYGSKEELNKMGYDYTTFKPASFGKAGRLALKKGDGIIVEGADGLTDEDLKAFELLRKDKENSKKVGVGEMFASAFKGARDSFVGTYKGAFTGDYTGVADFGNIIDQKEQSSNPSERLQADVAEKYNVGYAGAKLLGADDEKARDYGNIASNILLSVGIGGVTDVDGAGKTIKAIRNGDKLDEISKVNKFDDALDLAKKSNSYDDYVSSLGEKASKYSDEALGDMYNKHLDTYANDLMKDVNKGLGGINNFEGLKVGQTTVLNPEQIANISKNKLQSGLLQLGLGIYSPVGALMSNPLTDGLNKAVDNTEVGTALKKDLSKAFSGGKNNEWITAMKDNPSKALEYANERKQVNIAKKMSDKRVQEVMDTIHEYSDMKETPEELSKIIEEPTTRATREIEVEREINNPEYISKMMKLGKNEYNKQVSSIRSLQSKLKVQKEDLLKTAKKDATQNSSNLVAGLDSEINNLQKRLDKIESVTSVKSLDFNKQMAKFGYKDDYTDMFDKAISTDIESLTKEVGDRDFAEALQESANRVLDQLDEEFPGLSEHFTSYGKIDMEGLSSNDVDKYFNSPEEIEEFRNLNHEEKLEKSKQKLEEALDMDMKDGGKNPELNSKRIKYSTELVNKYQKEYIYKELDRLGIKLKKGDEYSNMIDNLGMTEADDFIKMVKSKKDYIAKSEAKSFRSKAIREYLGTEGKSLEDDLVNIAKKRVNEGGETYTLKHTENFKHTNASKKQTKVKSLEDFRVYRVKHSNLKNSLDDKKAMGIAKQLSYADGRKASMGIYENTIDRKLKNTLKTARKITSDDITSYVMKKDANKIAKEFVKESGLDIDYKDVANRINRMSYKEIKQEFLNISKELRDEVDNEYLDYVKALTDDEIELLKAQQSARKLQPQDVFGEYEFKDGKFVRANNKDIKKANSSKFITESKKLEEAWLEGETVKKDSGTLFEKAKNNTDDVLGVERGTPFIDAGSDISPLSGKNRNTFIDNDEYERLKARKTQEYMGTQYDADSVKQSEIIDAKRQKEAQRQKKMYDTLIRVYGEDKGKARYAEIIKKEAERLNRSISTQKASKEVASSSNKLIPFNDKTPLGKAVKSELPDDMKNIIGIKLNTANGEIVIDKNISKSELKKLIDSRKYSDAEKGSRIVYTNTDFDVEGSIGGYAKETDTIFINLSNLNKKQAQTILEHEVGHRIANKISKKYPELSTELMTEPFIDFVKELPDAKKEEFMNIIGRANKTNIPTKEMLDNGSFTKYLSLVKDSTDDTSKIDNETFAELFSLYNNKNKTVVKGIRGFNEEAYNNFVSKLDSLEVDEVYNVSKLARERFGDDYANQIIELKNKREAVLSLEKKISEATKLNEVMSKASDINKTNIKIDELKKELKELELSMDKHEFDADGNIISTDYDTFFNKMKERNPKAVADIDKKIPQYKTMKSLEEKVFEIDNTENLTPKAREYMDKFKASMKEIALREGIYEEDEAEAFTTYVMHMINPKYSDEADIVEKGKKLHAELKDPLNVNSLTRKKKGTIEQLNKQSEAQIGKRIFEENINRLWLKRAMNSDKTMLSKEANTRLLENFSIPIIRNFEKAVNESDHLMDNYGEELMEALGKNKKEVKELYKQSEKTSFEFVKDTLHEKFLSTVPNYKKMDIGQFTEYLADNGYDEYYTEKAIKFFQEGKHGVVTDVLFEGKYPMTNKFGYARSFRYKYGYDNYLQESPLSKIPKTTDDGRPYVYEAKKGDDGKKIDSKVDRTKEMPYDIEGQEPDVWYNEIKAYTEFVYKEAKNRNLIIVELPRENPETVIRRTISNKAMEQAIKDRTNLSENISMLMKGDKEAIEGFDALSGYNVIDPKLIKEEEFVLDSGTKKILVDKNAWENYQKAIKEAEYKEKNALLKVYDYFNNMFKSQALFSVGFHVRNSIQNVIASYIKTGINLLDAKKNKEALEILLYKNDKLKNLDVTYGGYNIDEILREAEFNGIFETEVKNLFDKDNTKKFLKGETDKLTKKKYSLGQSVNPFGTDFVGYRASNKVGGAIEEQAKMVNIITHLENGMNLSDAIQLTKDTLFDYSDLTQFESKVMKRVMPFYTFMRKNIPSQIDNLANHGARFGRIENIYRNASEKNEADRERALRPDYLDGQLALGNQKYINLGNASSDLKKLVNPLEMGSGLNPIIKTPIELIFNKQMYSGSDISKYDKPTEKLKYAVESSIPISKHVTALHKLITGTEVEQSKAQKTLSRVAGNMINTYDIDKQEKATMYDYIEELQNQYYEYLEKNPEAKAQVEAEAQKSKSPSYESPISRLLKKQR